MIPKRLCRRAKLEDCSFEKVNSKMDKFDSDYTLALGETYHGFISKVIYANALCWQ